MSSRCLLRVIQEDGREIFREYFSGCYRAENAFLEILTLGGFEGRRLTAMYSDKNGNWQERQDRFNAEDIASMIDEAEYTMTVSLDFGLDAYNECTRDFLSYESPDYIN